MVQHQQKDAKDGIASDSYCLFVCVCGKCFCERLRDAINGLFDIECLAFYIELVKL